MTPSPFVVLEAGFGRGERFLAAWRQHAGRLVFIAVDLLPPSHAELAAALRDTPDRIAVDALLAAWPPLTPNLHRLSFDGGRVQLFLLVSALLPGMSELVASVDAFVLNTSQRYDEHLCKALSRLAAPGATVAILNAAPAWRQGLKSSGFEVAEALVTAEPPSLRAVFAPSFTPRRAPARASRAAPSPTRHALIVGGGMAGCAAAWALAEQGWHSTVLERRSAIASEASGNAAGLFHGIVNAQDGLHARFNRAAALEARRAVQTAVAAHGVTGATHGLIRLESELGLTAMQSMLRHLNLPPSFIEAIDAAAASAYAGIALTQPAWFYPGGGWVHPGGLARSFLERAGASASLRLGVDAHALVRSASGWRALDAAGALIAEAEVVVLANAGDALRLLGDFNAGWDDAPASMEPVRGQISALNATELGWPLPQLPITGAGYLLPEVNGQALFGATAQRGDADAAVRRADHILNLEQLARLTGRTGTRLNVSADQLHGRTAWRWVTGDRLPIIGAVPDRPGSATWPEDPQRLDQPRFVPRQPGLFVFTALGSRGITWSALGAQILAAWVSGAPMPVEASLLDAVDPARFVARRFRRTK